MDTKDVELDELLSSLDDTTSGASAENSEKSTPSPVEAEAAPDTKNEELSPRAQERIRELLEENKKLKETKTITDTKEEDFIETIQDEPTKALVRKILDTSTKKAQETLSPVLKEYQKAQFDKTFDEYAKVIPGLEKWKETLEKDFNRDPNMDFKSKIGAIIVDLQLSRVKPIASQTGIASREKEEVNLDSLSKDELYAILADKKKR